MRARTPDLGAAGFGLDFQVLGAAGFGLDFQDLDRWLGELLARFDGRVLNDVDPFRELNPSAENLARWIFERLAERFDSLPAALAGVEVREGPRFTATYHPDQASAKP